MANVRICLICSHGGHLSELMQITEAFKDHDTFFITYESARTHQLEHKYLLKQSLHTGLLWLMLWMIGVSLSIFRILLKEKPDLIVSNGAELAIPAFYLAKLLRIKTIFIECYTRVLRPTGTGRIVYPVSDVFLVQWEQLLTKYGEKAKYEGAIF